MTVAVSGLMLGRGVDGLEFELSAFLVRSGVAVWLVSFSEMDLMGADRRGCGGGIGRSCGDALEVFFFGLGSLFLGSEASIPPFKAWSCIRRSCISVDINCLASRR